MYVLCDVFPFSSNLIQRGSPYFLGRLLFLTMLDSGSLIFQRFYTSYECVLRRGDLKRLYRNLRRLFFLSTPK